MRQDLITNKTIPCQDPNGGRTTEVISEIDVRKIEFPLRVNRVRFCKNNNGSPVHAFIIEDYMNQLSGSYEIEQTIVITNAYDRINIEYKGQFIDFTVAQFLETILEEWYVTPTVGNYVECGEEECTDYFGQCSNEQKQAQDEALEVIRENYQYIKTKYEYTSGGDSPFPVKVFKIALCNGLLFYILEEEWDLISHTDVQIIETLEFDDENSTIPMDDLITSLDKSDLFCLQLDYEPNGNIKTKTWQMAWRDVFRYSFNYDALNRLSSASFSEHFAMDGQRKKTALNRFSVPSVTYDSDGNIQSLNRNGINGYCDDGMPEYGPIDQLGYTYNGPQLTAVGDQSGSSYGFPGNGTYTYDERGNMKSDGSRGISNIDYNFLNLPNQIAAGATTIDYLYDGGGSKWGKTVVNSQGTRTYYYIDGVEYVDGVMSSIYLNEGRFAKNESGSWQMEYVIADHLGNARVTFADVNGDGSVSKNLDDGEILQEHHYYPFGMGWENSDQAPWAMHPLEEVGKNSKYQYNGKELQDEVLFTTAEGVEIQLGYYDYGARFYDPAIGRFAGVDLLAEMNSFQNPFVYADNNPIANIDLFGMDAASQEDMDRFEKAKSLGTTVYSAENPIYDENGSFLGTDAKGLEGDAIVMSASNFTQGMSHADAMSVGTTLSSACSSDCVSTSAFNKIMTNQDYLDAKVSRFASMLDAVTAPGYSVGEISVGLATARVASKLNASSPYYGIGYINTPVKDRYGYAGKSFATLKFLRFAGYGMAGVGLATSAANTISGRQSSAWFAGDAIATRIGFMGGPGLATYGLYQGNKWLYTGEDTQMKKIVKSRKFR